MKTIIKTNSLIVPTVTVTRTQSADATHVYVKRHTSPVTMAITIGLAIFTVTTILIAIVQNS
jgi:hypothetical protein